MSATLVVRQAAAGLGDSMIDVSHAASAWDCGRQAHVAASGSQAACAEKEVAQLGFAAQELYSQST
jgi:hypothetical protein